MSANKRDFSDFESFPGKVKTKYGNKIYVFPEIISEDSMGRKRFWVIYIRLIENKTGTSPARRKIDWDLSQDNVVNIKKSYYTDKLNNIIGQIWTEQGLVGTKDKNTKTTRSVPTYILKGKNIGKKNETNVFTQSLIQARSKYLKKLEQTTVNHSGRVFPVAVHKYEDKPRNKEKHIVYPCAVQRKLDGGRTVAYFNKDAKVELYTRKLKDLGGNTHIVLALDPLYELINRLYAGAYLDGELYKHGLSLQQISGIMRREADSKTSLRESKENPELEKIKLEFHIFDVFFPFVVDKQLLTLEQRLVILDDIFKQAEDSGIDMTYIKRVQNYIANDVDDESKLYQQFLEEKYEGSIIKNLAAPYEFGISREIRTYQMRKRKPRYSAEYEIVGYTEGEQGKDKGAIIWVLKTPGDKKKKWKSVEFTSTPVGMDYEKRYKLFTEMTKEKFESEYKGKMMTVEYDDISEEGVPLRAKAKTIRIID